VPNDSKEWSHSRDRHDEAALPRNSYCFAGARPVLPVPVGAAPVVLVPGVPPRLIARRWARPLLRAARRWARAWRCFARRCARVVRRFWRRWVGVCAPGACVTGVCAPGVCAGGVCAPGDCVPGACASASRLVCRVAGPTKAIVADSPKSKALRREIICNLVSSLTLTSNYSRKAPRQPSNGESVMMSLLWRTVKRRASSPQCRSKILCCL
jgi:hypothetical protein